MSKLPASIFLLLITGLSCFSQAQKSVAPTKWERYAVPDQQATVLLPKLPVVMNTGNTCRGEKRSDYGAYADGAAYLVSVVSKVDPPNLCPNRKVFDEENFTDGVAALLSRTFGDVKVSDVEIDGRKWMRIRGKNVVHMLYNDFDLKRWFEISISSHDPERIEGNDIFASLNFDQNIKGIPIRSGSKTMLGDAQTIETPVLVPPAAPTALPLPGTPAYERMGGAEGSRLKRDENDFKGPLIAMKPRPQYTESARKAGTKGEVTLKVAFLNNGSVGEISVVGKLSKGLTEESIAAARQILFVPAKKDKIAVSVTRLVEYHFNIY